MRTGLDYGYRSRCCYAPIRLGKKLVKNTSIKLSIWICTKCKARDVNIVEYTGKYNSETTPELNSGTSFIPDDSDESI